MKRWSREGALGARTLIITYSGGLGRPSSREGDISMEILNKGFKHLLPFGLRSHPNTEKIDFCLSKSARQKCGNLAENPSIPPILETSPRRWDGRRDGDQVSLLPY